MSWNVLNHGRWALRPCMLLLTSSAARSARLGIKLALFGSHGRLIDYESWQYLDVSWLMPQTRSSLHLFIHSHLRWRSLLAASITHALSRSRVAIGFSTQFKISSSTFSDRARGSRQCMIAILFHCCVLDPLTLFLFFVPKSIITSRFTVVQVIPASNSD
jgi:hypothetical protein